MQDDMTPLDANTAKPDAVNQICRAKGWSYNPYAPASLKEFSDRMLAEDAASAALPRRPFGREEMIAESFTTVFKPPTLFNGFPKAFGPAPGPTSVSAPPFTVLHVTNGTLGLVNDAPTVFDSEGYIHPTYSSQYYPILPHVGDGKCLKINEAIQVDGRAIAIIDNVGDINYCHWLCDWLPRLTAISSIDKHTFVVVLGCKASWQIETLQACGFDSSQIISLSNWQAVRAHELIVPSHINDIAHPAYKGAPWSLEFLNYNLDTLASNSKDQPSRVYFSRADARVRRIANENEFAAYLEGKGFKTYVASGMSVAEQARLFRSATSIISLHGAGLSNIVFCQQDCKVLEIVPDNYGMPTFWLLANGRGCNFATFIAESLIVGGISQTEDVIIDIKNFDSLAGDWLND